MISKYNYRMFVGYLFVIVLLSMCPSANSELLLDKQIENHFQKYLEERNCFEGIEHLGGPYLRVQYSKSVQEDITTFAYVRPLGVPGDPNQVSIKTYVLNAPVRIGLNEIETLQKAGSSPVFSQDDSPIFDALFETFKSIKIACSQQWRKNDRVVLITSDAEGNIVKKSVEDAIYYCGIEQIATDTWQLYFRRGHRIFESDELSGHIEFSPLTIIPADIVAIKSGMRPATNRGREEWKTEFFLYGQFDEAKLTDLWGTLRGNRIPAAAIKFDGHAAAVVYCQKHNAAPFGHPYFNAVVYSVILTQHKGMFTIHSLSAIIEEIPEGIRRGYTHVEVLLDKPPIDVVEKAVQKMVWPSWCNPLVDTDVTWEDRQKICELYLRVPHWEINYPEIEVEKDDILKVKVFPQETGDFGRPTLTLLKINDISVLSG